MFSLDDRRIARQGAIVFAGDTAVGEVLSGTLSPVLNNGGPFFDWLGNKNALAMNI
jgi:hypothetical protein